MTHSLFEILLKEYPDQVERVFSQEYCDIDETFLGFMDTYEALSKVIPKYWTILDIGCSYCAQGYYFKDHKKYIGIDRSRNEVFQFKNSEYFIMNIALCATYYGAQDKDTFAILNYVPCTVEESLFIRQSYPNLYCYYPYGEFK